MNENLPFYLQPNEILTKDAPIIQYYGVGLVNIGFAGGGITNSGLGGGIFTSTQHKREKSIFDAVSCHVYLTNKRLVFVKAKLNFSASEEKGLDTLFSDIPLNFIEGIKTGTKFGLHSTIDLSVRSPTGEINQISFAFLDSGAKREGMFDVGRRFRREPERDAFLKLIEINRENMHEDLIKPLLKEDVDDPLKILKIRYAKGEITKEEYEEMARILK